MRETLLEPGRATLLDLLDRLLETGVAVDGEIDLSVADINLVHLGLKLVLASSATLEQHNHGGAIGLAENMDGSLRALSGECSLASASCPSLPMLIEAEPQPGADALPVRSAERTSPRFAPGRVSPLPARMERPDLETSKIEHGLAKLALTLVELIRRLMERQAVRKMERGTLTETQVERLGEAFRLLEKKMVELKHAFGLDDEELNLDLGPLGALM